MIDPICLVRKRRKLKEFTNIYDVRTEKSHNKMHWNLFCDCIKRKFNIFKKEFSLLYVTSYGEEIIINSELMFEKAINEIRNIKGDDISANLKVLIGPEMKMEYNRHTPVVKQLTKLKRLHKININEKKNKDKIISKQIEEEIPNLELEAQYNIIYESYEKEKLRLINEKGVRDVKFLKEKDFSEVTKFVYKKVYQKDLFPSSEIPKNIEERFLKYLTVYENYNPHPLNREPLLYGKSLLDSFISWINDSKQRFLDFMVERREINEVGISIEYHGNKSFRMRFTFNLQLMDRIKNKIIRKYLTRNFVFFKHGVNLDWEKEEATNRLLNFYKFVYENLTKMNSIPITLSDF